MFLCIFLARPGITLGRDRLRTGKQQYQDNQRKDDLEGCTAVHGDAPKLELNGYSLRESFEFHCSVFRCRRGQTGLRSP